jgi:predicted metal-dependent peptidase
MLQHPYLANAVARLPVVNASDLDWCTTMATDGYYIYVDAGFCSQITEEELAAVIAHEILHCVLGHMDRRGVRDRRRWNVAIDYAVNLLLVDAGFQLPKAGLLDRNFRGMTAEEIYDLLETRVDGGSQIEAERQGEDSKGSSDPMQPSRRSPGGFDDHIETGDLEGSAMRAAEYPSERERIRLRSALGKELKRKLPGREAGYYAEEINRGGAAKVSWQQLLARFFTGLRRDNYRSFPFNRKHLWRQIFLPSVGTPGPDHIVVAVDTSASMSADELSQALAEIDALRGTANCNLTLIQCDTEVKSVDQYDPWEMSSRTFERLTFVGRGGTSLIPPFEWIITNVLGKGRELDALVYITDGYGPVPLKAPVFPTLWLVPKEGFRAPPFGELIRI